MAKKVLWGPQFLRFLQNATEAPTPSEEWTPGEGLLDPDGNLILTAGAGVAPPISGLKGATVVAVGSVVLSVGDLDVTLEAVTPGAHKWFIPTCFVVSSGKGAHCSIGGYFGASNNYVLHLVRVGGGSVTVFYKVYRIDES